MLNTEQSSSKKPHFNAYYISENCVPDGFVTYYNLMELNKNNVLKVLDYYLQNNELKNAVAYFIETTKYNTQKVWH